MVSDAEKKLKMLKGLVADKAGLPEHHPDLHIYMYPT